LVSIVKSSGDQINIDLKRAIIPSYGQLVLIKGLCYD